MEAIKTKGGRHAVVAVGSADAGRLKVSQAAHLYIPDHRCQGNSDSSRCKDDPGSSARPFLVGNKRLFAGCYSATGRCPIGGTLYNSAMGR